MRENKEPMGEPRQVYTGSSIKESFKLLIKDSFQIVKAYNSEAFLPLKPIIIC
jgi:hypothetical protein